MVKTVDFGAFVNFLGSRDGLVHISELAPHRVGKVADVVKLGDMVKVKVLGFDDRGKVKLSMRRSISRPARTSARAARSRERGGPADAPFAADHRRHLRFCRR